MIKNAKLDKEGGILGTSHPKVLTEVEEIQINLDLGDIWRDQNPLDKRFTWRRRNPSISCRLDFFLLSRHLYGKVAKSDIVAGYKTDHSMISLSLGLTENIRGPGLWKLNTSFLSDEEYLRANVCNFRESVDSRKVLNFFIFCSNNLYSTLSSKITLKLVTAFYFFRNQAKFEKL